jgi:hypothetical protein
VKANSTKTNEARVDAIKRWDFIGASPLPREGRNREPRTQ